MYVKHIKKLNSLVDKAPKRLALHRVVHFTIVRFIVIALMLLLSLLHQTRKRHLDDNDSQYDVDYHRQRLIEKPLMRKL